MLVGFCYFIYFISHPFKSTALSLHVVEFNIFLLVLTLERGLNNGEWGMLCKELIIRTE